MMVDQRSIDLTRWVYARGPVYAKEVEMRGTFRLIRKELELGYINDRVPIKPQ